MLGAILGDIIGSPYEFDRNNIKTKEFPLFGPQSGFTDDTVMTLAVAEGLMNSQLVIEEGDERGLKADAEESSGGDEEKIQEQQVKQCIISSMRRLGLLYPDAGYGMRFFRWLFKDEARPYGSFGNGSAMRVSSVGWLFDDLEQVLRFAEFSAEVTHNHPEGIKGAQATAAAIFLARQRWSKREIREYLEREFDYELGRTAEQIRPGYRHVESCQETVPEAIIAFLEGEDFEDCVRTAVSLGGDSDTIAAITGSIAEAYYGIPEELKERALAMLDEPLLAVLERWRELWIRKKEGEDQRLAKALEFAEEKHRGQTRKGGEPYIVHPQAVAKKLKDKGYPVSYQIAGLFHDLLEDTDAAVDELELLGGRSVAEAVILVTKEEGCLPEQYVRRINANPMARAVKCADRIDNLECAADTEEAFQQRYLEDTLRYYACLDQETLFCGEIHEAAMVLKEHLEKASEN